MVATKLDEKKLRQELIKVYERFIENPGDKKNRERFSELDRKYSGASDLIQSKVLVEALNNWSFLWQREIPGQENHAIDPKEMLRRLKEEV